MNTRPLAKLRVRARFLAVLLAMLVSVPVGPTRTSDERRPSPAREYLNGALAERLLASRATGEERIEARRRIAGKLEAIARTVDYPAAIRAEAAFRGGEIRRADGASENALHCFRLARELGAATPFRTRAMLEIGHLHRRAEHWSLALDSFFAVSHDRSARLVERDAALYWSGVIWCECGELNAARRVWRQVARFAERQLDCVRAYDQWSLLEFNCGNLQAARDVLAVCDTQLNPIASEYTAVGASLRRALARMRSRRVIATPTDDGSSVEARVRSDSSNRVQD